MEAVFKEIIETTRTGTESRILEFYKKILLPHQEGLTVEQATKEYIVTAKKPLFDYTIRYWLNRLNKIGYVDKKKQGPTNEKTNVYTPLTENVENGCNSEIQTNLESKIEKDFETWLNGLFEKQLITNKYFISVDGSKEEISIDQLKENVLELPIGFSNIHFEHENNSKNEKDNGYIGKGEIQTNLTPDIELCSKVCGNFSTPSCSAKNPLERPLEAVKPLKCPGFRDISEQHYPGAS